MSKAGVRSSPGLRRICGAVLFVGWLSGCAHISSYFSPKTGASSSVQQAQISTPTPTATPTHHHHRRAHRRISPTPSSTARATPGITPTATPSSTPSASVISMRDDSSQMRLADQQIAQNDQKLGLIKANTLSGAQAEDFRQARELNRQAHEALQRHDYVAARGLAEKAALLSGRLAATPSAAASGGA